MEKEPPNIIQSCIFLFSSQYEEGNGKNDKAGVL